MKRFHLPDLGEGLQEAQIIRWKVKPGDEVFQDQVLVLVETAKATVDIPSPRPGRIKKLYGDTGDTIPVGAPLLDFAESEHTEASESIVGKVEQTEQILEEMHKFSQGDPAHQQRIVPAARLFAKKFHIDLHSVTPTGPNNTITMKDVEKAHTRSKTRKELSSTGRSMALNMTKIHQSVVPVTLMDDADLHSWGKSEDLMLRVIRAICHAKDQEPSVNVHYDHQTLSIQSHEEIHLGIAVDSPHGLYVPVIRDISKLSPERIRAQINIFKQKAKTQSFTTEDLSQPTIILSNYGSIMGRYATPLVVPPTVFMIGIGRAHDAVCPHKNSIEIHRILPVSISLDHRVLTGGEGARFLKAFIEHLERAN